MEIGKHEECLTIPNTKIVPKANFGTKNPISSSKAGYLHPFLSGGFVPDQVS